MDEKVKKQCGVNRQIASYQSRVEGSPQLEPQYMALTPRLLSWPKVPYEDNVTARAKFRNRQRSGRAQSAVRTWKCSDLRERPADALGAQPAADGRRWAPDGPDARHRAGRCQEMKNTSLKNLKDVRAYTNLPVLSSIPLLENALLVQAQAAAAVAGVVERDYHRLHRHERGGLLLLLRSPLSPPAGPRGLAGCEANVRRVVEKRVAEK